MSDPSDPGECRPPTQPLYVGWDAAADEFVEVWLQYNKSKDTRIQSLPFARAGACSLGVMSCAAVAALLVSIPMGAEY